MSTPPEYFNRVAGSSHINFPLLQGKRVVVVGVGQVGSLIAAELAQNGVGNLVVIDHDVLEGSNLYRHVLLKGYVGWNKAEALTDCLDREVDNLNIEAVPFRVEPAISDRVLDGWLSDADLIVAATDDPDAQKRVGGRALALDIPVLFPALYPEDDPDSGEVIVQLDRQYPCYGCWTGFREGAEHLRGVTATIFRGFPVIFTSLMLCVAVLDPASECSDLLANGPEEPPNQAFILGRFGALREDELDWRTDCPVCGSGPAQGRATTTHTGNFPGRAFEPSQGVQPGVPSRHERLLVYPETLTVRENRSAASSFEDHVAQRVEELRSLPTRPDRSALQARLKRILVVLACNVLVELVLVFGVPDLFFHAFAHWQATLLDFVDEGSYLRKTIAGVIAGWMVLPVILIGSCVLTLQGFAAEDWTARVGGYAGALIAGFFWGIQAVALVTMGHTVRGFWS